MQCEGLIEDDTHPLCKYLKPTGDSESISEFMNRDLIISIGSLSLLKERFNRLPCPKI